MWSWHDCMRSRWLWRENVQESSTCGWKMLSDMFKWVYIIRFWRYSAIFFVSKSVLNFKRIFFKWSPRTLIGLPIFVCKYLDTTRKTVWPTRKYYSKKKKNFCFITRNNKLLPESREEWTWEPGKITKIIKNFHDYYLTLVMCSAETIGFFVRLLCVAIDRSFFL